MLGRHLPLHWLFEYQRLTELLKLGIASHALADQVRAPQTAAFWHALSAQHGVKIDYMEEDTFMLMQTARIAAACLGEAWLLKNKQDMQNFIEKGRAALRGSDPDLGHGVRFSFLLKAAQAEALQLFLSKVQCTPWKSVGDRPCHETTTPIWIQVENTFNSNECWQRLYPTDKLLEEADCSASLRINCISSSGGPKLSLGLGLWWSMTDGMGISINSDTGEETWYGSDPAKEALYGRRFCFTPMDYNGRPDSVTVDGGFAWTELWQSDSLDEGGHLAISPALLEVLKQLALGGPVRCFLGQCR